MSNLAQEGGLLAFGEQVLSLLDEASYSTTYKHALLLGLVDTLRASTDAAGQTSDRLPVRLIAERVLELYWPQTFPFIAQGAPHVLRQSRTREARVVTLILRFKAAEGLPQRGSFATAARTSSFPRLVNEVEWVLAEMPLPRFQHPYANFIYELDWSASTTRGVYMTSSRTVKLFPDAARYLVALANLLRPIVERRWGAMVAAMNPALVEESFLDRFLFNPERQPPIRLAKNLLALQNNLCFYCGKPPVNPHVDHFLPWTLTGDDGLDNLVVTCRACNLDKAAVLPSGLFVSRWASRLRPGTADFRTLEQLATDSKWPRHPNKTLGWARSLYLASTYAKLLWNGHGNRVGLAADLPSIQSALS